MSALYGSSQGRVVISCFHCESLINISLCLTIKEGSDGTISMSGLKIAFVAGLTVCPCSLHVLVL